MDAAAAARMNRAQSGFTLIEVVVAVAVIGASFAAGLAAMSGSLRLLRSAAETEQAMLLARSAMIEALAYPDHDIVADAAPEIYQGVDYGVRVEFRPVRLADREKTQPAPPPVLLQQISVDVFWGEGRSKTYRLVTYRRVATAGAGATRERDGASSGSRPEAAVVPAPAGGAGSRPAAAQR